MILIDTSAWIEFLRGTGSAPHLAVRQAVNENTTSTTDPIIMELLAGARGDQEVRDLHGLLGRSSAIRCNPADYLFAAEIFRTVRRARDMVRNSMDCLIAAIAIRTDTPLLHADRDFDKIARNSALNVVNT